jgi:hypothetical protein
MTTKQAKQLIGKTVELRHFMGRTQSCAILEVKNKNIKIDHLGVIDWLWATDWTFLGEVE